MPIDITMPALSPTMEVGTLAKWLVKVGDTVKSGDLLAEIETDKATMEVESIDEGEVAELLVAEGAENIPVGAVILRLKGEGEVADAPATALRQAQGERGDEPGNTPKQKPVRTEPVEARAAEAPARPSTSLGTSGDGAKSAGSRVIASPLARRIAAAKGLDLAGLKGSGPGGRIVKADVEGAAAAPAPARPAAAAAPEAPVPAAAAASAPPPVAAIGPPFTDIPHVAEKLSNVRKVIARRLTEAKATVPHYYLTLDVRLDALLKLRGELNAALEPRGVKLSVNDMLVKALAVALLETPRCNVSFAGDQLLVYSRADISVAVAAPSGLITPIIVDAGAKSLSAIATSMKALAEKARAGKLQPHEYQGGTASLSNLGMYGIKQFDAVINPPQGMILAVGAGEKRPWVEGEALTVATVMTATGSFDHRAIDGADGAQLMAAFKRLVEAPLGLVA